MVIFCFAILGARLVYVQAFLRTDLQKKAQKQLPSKMAGVPERLQILDRSGVILAETVQVASCFVDVKQVADKTKTARIIADTLGLNFAVVHNQLRNARSSFTWIKRNVPADAAARLREKKLPGVGFKKEWRRHYPMGPLAGHLMGLVGYEGRGLSGIEQYYNETLTGRAAEKNPSALVGNVQLSLNGKIQQIVERELAWGAEKIHAKRGTVIVQDPSTGEILAMASWPPMALTPDNPPPATELRIPAIVDVFEPGSTYKIVTAAAAIEEEVIKKGELFSGEKGKWKISAITIHDHEPSTYMTFEDIMARSSNIGVAKIADRLGSQKMYQYSRLFGFGVFPGSGLPAEAKGNLRPITKWSGVSKYTVSFGQEVSVTALQLAGAYSAVANGGMLMEPGVVRAVVAEDGNVLWSRKPSVVRRVISAECAKQLTSMLAHVVEAGTGQYAQVQWRQDVKVAGKTGTAQKFDVARKRYHEHKTLVSFCGFFPADAPKFTMVVILDEPEGRRWGGSDAAPVFRRIAEQLMPDLSI